jgi:hypothetical protein
LRSQPLGLRDDDSALHGADEDLDFDNGDEFDVPEFLK